MDNRTKILALYLPQYYETDYNSNWWGKHYTEWTACKQSKPLFKGQYQPKAPINSDYYDLSNIRSIEKQFNLAKKYGLDGFVIYQYYSANNSEYGKKLGKNGSLLLNKPTEMILKNKHLNLPFCLYWANHHWRKAWFGQDEKILWRQEYGDKNDWIEYFYYNLNFFNDSRYIKINNKPIFIVFAVWDFIDINEFMECWNELAQKNGFNGIFFIKTADARTSDNIGNFDAIFRREPFYTFAKGFGKINFAKRVFRTRFAKISNKILNKFGKGIVGYKCNYDEAWNSIISRNDYSNKIIPGAFADWDNTARKQYNSQILTDSSPQKFGKHLEELYEKCINNDVPFIIINAWNEWAEGAYLEPDDKYGYKWLEQISKIKKAKQNQEGMHYNE